MFLSKNKKKVGVLMMAIFSLGIGIIYGADTYKVDVGECEYLNEFGEDYSVNNGCSYDLHIPASTEAEFLTARDDLPSCAHVDENCYTKTSSCDSTVCCDSGDTLMEHSVSDTCAGGDKRAIITCCSCS